MNFLIYFFYRNLAVPLLLAILWLVRPFARGKIKEILEDHQKSFGYLSPAWSLEDLARARPVWIHAASGEIEYARPLIREIKKSHPQIPILVTYTSPSAKKILRTLTDIAAWTILPWDDRKDILRFLKDWNPRCLLFSRTDVWPVLTDVLMQKKIPMALFSATFAENSSRLRGPSRFLTAQALQNLQQIHCVSEADKNELNKLTLSNKILVTGDTRFDQVFHRLENPRPVKSELLPSPDDFVFIAGSTWSEDETVLVEALAKPASRGLRVIFAPHEVTEQHLESLEKSLVSKGLKSIRYSESLVWPAEAVLILDVVGLLAEIYTWGDLAFVGGSFKHQVHSVMEPLAAGLPVLVGPYHLNNREALSYQKRNFSSGLIVQVVQNADDISVLLERIRKQHPRMNAIKEDIRAEVTKDRHATLLVLESLQSFFK